MTHTSSKKKQLGEVFALLTNYCETTTGAESAAERVWKLHETYLTQALKELKEEQKTYHYERNIGEGFFHAVPIEAIDNKIKELEKLDA